MRKALLAALVPLMCLALPSVASAHYITSQSLTCEGVSFSWASFPQGDNQFNLKWVYGTTTIKTQTVDGWTGSSGTGSVGPIPLPSVPPNGTDVQVFGTWTADGGGSFDVSQTLNCQPVVTNVSIDCQGFHFTWTSQLPSPTITVSWKAPSGWASTTIQESGHSGTTTVPLPTTPPNGTVITGMASWNGGSTPVVSSQPTTCLPPPTPPAPPAPSQITPPAVPPPAPPVPPTPPRHHRHRPHVTPIVLRTTFFNQDPQPFAGVASAAPFGCRIVGPPKSQLHGLAHWVVRCRSVRVLAGGKWYVDNHRVRNEHWTYTSDGDRVLNSWLFDGSVWWHPAVWGHYTITYRGHVRH